MTKDAINKVKSGTEMNVLIARHVMGWEHAPPNDVDGGLNIRGKMSTGDPSRPIRWCDFDERDLPEACFFWPSTDLNFAVEALQECFLRMSQEFIDPSYAEFQGPSKTYGWCASISKRNRKAYKLHQGLAETPAMAICRALLMWAFEEEPRKRTPK